MSLKHRFVLVSAALVFVAAAFWVQGCGNHNLPTESKSGYKTETQGQTPWSHDLDSIMEAQQQEFTILSHAELIWSDAKLDMLRHNPKALPVGSSETPGSTPVLSIRYMDQFSDTLQCVIYQLPGDGTGKMAVVTVKNDTIRSLIVEMTGQPDSETSTTTGGITISDPSGQPLSTFTLDGNGLLKRVDQTSSGLSKPALSWWDRFLSCVASKWQSTVPWFIRGACFACKVPSLYGPWACYSCVIGQGYWGWIVISYCSVSV